MTKSLTIWPSRDRVAVFIHLEKELGVVQAKGAIISTCRLEVASNAVQGQHILHNLHSTAQPT